MIMWAIKTSEHGKIMAHTVRETRREAIEQVAVEPELSWSKLYGRGLRAVRVVVKDQATVEAVLASFRGMIAT